MAEPTDDTEIDEPSTGPRQRGWVWYSTPKSATARTVSVLALVETLAAVGIYIWIAVSWGTLHLLIAACVTPFLLLRTEESIKLGLKFSTKYLLIVYPYYRFLQDMLMKHRTVWKFVLFFPT